MSRRGLLKTLVTLSGVLGVFLAVLLLLAVVLVVMAGRLPDLRANPHAFGAAETSVVYAADGSVLAEWYDEEDRTVVDVATIPEDLKNAVVAIEDKRFYEHGGVDLRAIGRALSVNTEAGEVLQGGSTITQQTVKLLYTDGKRTLGRKIEEALLAVSLETRADKADVLGVYLNTVYFGRGAYGVESAAKRFFDSTTSELTLSQSALLAGCIQSPTRYDPFVNPEAALARRNLVLDEMAAQGFIGEAQADALSAQPLAITSGQEDRAGVAQYFLEYVRRDLLQRLGSERLYRGGLRIYTTLDPGLQAAAEQAAHATLPDAADPEVALIAVRPADGAVLAVVGGRDFSARQFDLATQGRRQTGSAFKPFVLAAALEHGYSLQSTFDAAPYSVKVKDEMWTVENYENYITSGTYTLEQATIQSINTVYARLIVELGPENVVDVAERMGIVSPIDPDPAIALGGLKTGVTPLEMASAFSTIANRGTAVAPSGIVRVVDESGGLVYAPDRTGTEAIEPGIADTLAGVLNKVYTTGTGTAANFGQWGAVKTGTAQSWRDAWTVGWSGDVCCAVWVGYPDAQLGMENVHGQRVTGGSFPATAWKAFMQAASTRSSAPAIPAEGDAVPVGMEVYHMCSDSNLLARDDCPDTMDLLLPAGSVSAERCTLDH